MTQITKEDIMNAMNWRAAVKIFDTEKKVSEEDLNTILEAGRLSPSAYGLQPVRIVQVDNEMLRSSLKEVSFGQRQVIEAPHFYVITCVKDPNDEFIHKFVELTAQTRGQKVEDLNAYEQMMKGDIGLRSVEGKFAWSGRQAYIALGAMIETAALLGIDAGPMEGFVPSKVDEILGLDKLGLTALAYLAIGYRKEDEWSKMNKVRVSKEEFIIKK